MTLCCGGGGAAVDEVSWLWQTLLELFLVQTINPHLFGLIKYKPPCEEVSFGSMKSICRILTIYLFRTVCLLYVLETFVLPFSQ